MKLAILLCTLQSFVTVSRADYEEQPAESPNAPIAKYRQAANEAPIYSPVPPAQLPNILESFFRNLAAELSRKLALQRSQGAPEADAARHMPEAQPVGQFLWTNAQPIAARHLPGAQKPQSGWSQPQFRPIPMGNQPEAPVFPTKSSFQAPTAQNPTAVAAHEPPEATETSEAKTRPIAMGNQPEAPVVYTKSSVRMPTMQNPRAVAPHELPEATETPDAKAFLAQFGRAAGPIAMGNQPEYSFRAPTAQYTRVIPAHELPEATGTPEAKAFLTQFGRAATPIAMGNGPEAPTVQNPTVATRELPEATQTLEAKALSAQFGRAASDQPLPRQLQVSDDFLHKVTIPIAYILKMIPQQLAHFLESPLTKIIVVLAIIRNFFNQYLGEGAIPVGGQNASRVPYQFAPQEAHHETVSRKLPEIKAEAMPHPVSVRKRSEAPAEAVFGSISARKISEVPAEASASGVSVNKMFEAYIKAGPRPVSTRNLPKSGISPRQLQISDDLLHKITSPIAYILKLIPQQLSLFLESPLTKLVVALAIIRNFFSQYLNEADLK